ncbi:ADO2, partial [Symbiodinium microadriaticum]
MWIYGGENGDVLNDVFYIDLSQVDSEILDSLAWVQVPASGTIPTGRWRHMAAMDSKNKMWIVGGDRRLGGASDLSNEVFYLDTNKVPPEWVQVNASGYIPPIHSAAAAMDSRDRLWVMGGMLRTTD